MSFSSAIQILRRRVVWPVGLLACLLIGLGSPRNAVGYAVHIQFTMGWAGYDISGLPDDGSGYDNYNGDGGYASLGFVDGVIAQLVFVDTTQGNYTGVGGNAEASVYYDDMGENPNHYGLVADKDPESHFEYTYHNGEEPFEPTTTKEGQQIVGTYNMTLTSDAYGSYLTLDLWVDYDQYVGMYDALYIRVFSTNEFGELQTNVWGISAVYRFQYGSSGTGGGDESVYLAGIEIMGTNTFEIIPEPGSMALLATGGTALFAVATRRRRKKRSATCVAAEQEDLPCGGKERDSS